MSEPDNPVTRTSGGEMKIEVGKYYRMRNGRKVGPMEPYGEDEFIGREELKIKLCFFADGHYLKRGEQSELDIVSEWIDPVVQPAWPPEAVASCQAATRDAQKWQAEADRLKYQLEFLSKQLISTRDKLGEREKNHRLDRVAIGLAKRAIESGAIDDATAILTLALRL